MTHHVLKRCTEDTAHWSVEWNAHSSVVSLSLSFLRALRLFGSSARALTACTQAFAINLSSYGVIVSGPKAVFVAHNGVAHLSLA